LNCLIADSAVLLSQPENQRSISSFSLQQLHKVLQVLQ
jgi:hypothetical protein